MSTTALGREGERIALDYVCKTYGFRCIARNWRTSRCEIDLVMLKGTTVYFVEVKLRKTDTYGSGSDYVTPSKLRQMRYAAENWIASNNWTGNAELMAIAVQNSSVIDVFFIDR